MGEMNTLESIRTAGILAAALAVSGCATMLGPEISMLPNKPVWGGPRDAGECRVVPAVSCKFVEYNRGCQAFVGSVVVTIDIRRFARRDVLGRTVSQLSVTGVD